MSLKDNMTESPLDSAPPANLVQIQVIKKNHWVPSRYNARATNEDGSIVIWNTYTGAMNVFEAGDGARLDKLLRNRDGFAGELKGLAKYLYERGYLIAKGTNEYRQVQLMAGQQQYRSDTLELILLASEDCNFRCVYCYEDFQRGTMAPAVREAIKKHVEKRARDLKRFEVRWFGGEPLYGFQAIEDLAPFFVETAEKYSIGFASHMTTNGYLLTPEVAGKLLEWRITDFQITLDGLAEQHDAKRPARDGCKTFETIHSNLQSLQKRADQFLVAIRINFDRENYGYLEPLLELLEKDFSGDERFELNFHKVGKWGGPNDSELSVCGAAEARSVKRDLRQSALDRGLNIGGLHRANKPGQQVCYAARPYNFIIGADGALMKCTIALDKKDYNIVGKITGEGELDLDFNKYALWTEPAFESDAACRKCYLLPSCQGMYCPMERMEEGEYCPPIKGNIRSELLTSLEVSRAKTRASLPRVVSRDNSIPVQENNGDSRENGFSTSIHRQFGHGAEPIDFSSDEARIKGLSAADLVKDPGNFYPYFYLNLLSILGGRLPLEQIRSLAVERTRGAKLSVNEHLRFLSGLLEPASQEDNGRAAGGDRELIRLRGWDLDLIGSLLQRGKGLIFCSHHLGPYKFLPHELALMGFKVALILDEVTFNESSSHLDYIKGQFQSASANASTGKKASAFPENIRLLNLLNAQQEDSLITMLRVLERGESIFVYADGNTGWDGVWGSSAKSVIDFLGFPIAVKNGIARLAAASRTPILPLVALRSATDFGRLIFGKPIIPPLKMTPEVREEFLLETMKSVYKLLEEYALEFIDQWSSSCFLHRWRIPAGQSPTAAPDPSDLEEVEKRLALGKSFKLNEQRIAPLTVKNETVLIDVQTLKTYKAPEGFGNLFLRLSEKGGLKDSDISSMNDSSRGRQKILGALARLMKLNVIVPN